MGSSLVLLASFALLFLSALGARPEPASHLHHTATAILLPGSIPDDLRKPFTASLPGPRPHSISWTSLDPRAEEALEGAPGRKASQAKGGGGGSPWSCVCADKNAVSWVRDWFFDCVSTPLEVLSFSLGLSSILFWLVAQLPQFIQNIYMGSAEALSPWFLFQWLSGDLLNLLGCLLTGTQLATQTYTAVYFLFSDCCIISQYVFYSILNRERKELAADCHSEDGETPSLSQQYAQLKVPLLPGPTTPSMIAVEERDRAKVTPGGRVYQDRRRMSSADASHKVKKLYAVGLGPVEEIVEVATEGISPRSHGAGHSAQAQVTADHTLPHPHPHPHPQLHHHLPYGHHVEHHPHYHPAPALLTGRSGAVMIAHAMHPTHPPLGHPSAAQGAAEVRPFLSGWWPAHHLSSSRTGAAKGDAEAQGESVGIDGENCAGQSHAHDSQTEARGAPGEVQVSREQVSHAEQHLRRRQLRRLVEAYGLEYGPPMPRSRLTIHHQRAGRPLQVPSKPGGPHTGTVVLTHVHGDPESASAVPGTGPGEGTHQGTAEGAGPVTRLTDAGALSRESGQRSTQGLCSTQGLSSTTRHSPGSSSQWSCEDQRQVGASHQEAPTTNGHALYRVWEGQQHMQGTEHRPEDERGASQTECGTLTCSGNDGEGKTLKGEEAQLQHRCRDATDQRELTSTGSGRTPQPRPSILLAATVPAILALCFLALAHISPWRQTTSYDTMLQQRMLPSRMPLPSQVWYTSHGVEVVRGCLPRRSKHEGKGEGEGDVAGVRATEIVLQHQTHGGARDRDSWGWHEDRSPSGGASRGSTDSMLHTVGLLLGWGSAAFYLASRVSQIALNAQRGSAEGLSMAMFVCAFCANFTYGSAILLRAHSLSDLTAKAPWLIGSVGTLSLDVAIYLQAWHLDAKNRAVREGKNVLQGQHKVIKLDSWRLLSERSDQQT